MFTAKVPERKSSLPRLKLVFDANNCPSPELVNLVHGQVVVLVSATTYAQGDDINLVVPIEKHSDLDDPKEFAYVLFNNSDSEEPRWATFYDVVDEFGTFHGALPDFAFVPFVE